MPISSLTGQRIGPAPVLQGASPQGGAGTYGKVPTVPSPAGTQGQAIAGNMGNLGQLYGLTGSLNTEAAQQAVLPYNLNLPNYQGMVGQSSQNILSNLKGQIPQDVANQISQMAAERGVSTGSIGSPNSNSALLRALGLTSLGLQQQGEQQLSGAVARTPTGTQFNPQSFLTTPSQQQEAAYLANLYSAAPTPGAGDQANLQNLLKGLGGLGGPGGVRGGAPGAPGADFFGNVYSPPGGDPGMFSYGGNPIMAGAGGALPGAIPGAAGGGAGTGNFYAGSAAGAPGGQGGYFQPGGAPGSSYFSGQQPLPGGTMNNNLWADQFNQEWDQGYDVGGPFGADMMAGAGLEQGIGMGGI